MGDYTRKVLDFQTTWTAGFAFYFSGIATQMYDTWAAFLGIASSTTPCCTLLINGSGTLAVGYGSGGSATIVPTEVTLSAGVWTYLEFEAVLGTATGQITLRVNGATVYQSAANLNLQASNADTVQIGAIYTSGSIGWTRHAFWNNSSFVIVYDDLYVCDQQPGATGFLGDISVVPLLPNGAGASTQFAIGGSTPAPTNWQSVNDNPPDDDVTYVYSSTAGQQDLYTVQTHLPVPAAPTLSSASTGGTVPAGTYQAEVTYVNADGGETTVSTSAQITTTGSTSTITIASPPAAGSGGTGLAASGWYAYVTQAGGSTFTRQQAAGSPTSIGTNLTLTAPPTSTGAKPPAANTTGLPASGSVLGVQPNLFARKDDAGTRTIAPLVHTGANTAAGTGQNIGGSYADYLQVWETNPANGSTAWSLSEFATDQFGVEEVA